MTKLNCTDEEFCSIPDQYSCLTCKTVSDPFAGCSCAQDALFKSMTAVSVQPQTKRAIRISNIQSHEIKGGNHMKEANHNICRCLLKDQQHVHIDTLKTPGHELKSLNGIYCITCNSFWREP